jgi:hypothetical protein
MILSCTFTVSLKDNIYIVLQAYCKKCIKGGVVHAGASISCHRNLVTIQYINF